MDKQGDLGSSARDLKIAGLIATTTAVAALWAIASLAGPAVPFAPASLADALIRWAPGAVSTFFIDLLKHWAIRLLAAGVLAATLAFGSFVLLWTARRGRARPMIAGACLAALAAVAIVVGPSNDEEPVTMAIALGGTALLYAAVASRLLIGLSNAGEHDAGRRKVLRMGAGGAAGLAVAGGVVGWIANRLGGPNTDVPLAAPEVRATIPARPPFPEIAGLTPEVTSTADHYVVDINFVQPSVEAEGWTLNVTGLVDSPLSLTFDDLQRNFEVVEEYSVLTCISNEVGGNLVGNSLWGGVRLRDVLEEAGVRDGAVDLIFKAADGYTDSIPVEVAMQPYVLLAVSQNRAPLRQEHGFPCRVRVPSIYGMKNVKWITEIEVVSEDYQGYWMQRGWSDEAVIKTQSRIDVVGTERTVTAGTDNWIAGVAWAGDRGISKVEVSTDGGRTWAEAMLRDPIGAFCWTQWAYAWRPDRKQRAEVVCRATDGKGELQIEETSPPHPSGSTGYHRVSARVV